MPKFPTFPTLFDECKTLSISDLKRWEYLNPYSFKSGTMTWSRNGNNTGSISIRTNINSESPYLELDYKCNEQSIKYRVQLVSLPSNLGKGIVWFFICPRSGKRCRKLYLVDTYFYHRSAFKGCMYEKQTQSHKNRRMYKQYGTIFDSETACEQIYSKHFKKYYRGKPTKRYLKLLKKAEHQVSQDELERLLLS